MVLLALVGSFAIAVPPAAALDPIPDDAPTAGQEISVEFYSEPEFLLTAGAERWNVRNTPDGTVAAAYGVPADAVDDAYARTGRYDPLDSAPVGGVLDVSIRRARPAVGLEHSWAFVRKANGAAEVWGPADLGYPERFVIEPVSAAPEDRIQGGTVTNDVAGVPHALLVTADGRLLRAVGGAATVEVGSLDIRGSAVVGAVARDHTGYELPAYNVGTPRTPPGQVGRFDREILPGTWGLPDVEASVLALVLASGEVLVAPLDGSVPGDTSTLAARFSALDLASTSTPLVDMDFSCFAGEYNDPDFRGDLRTESSDGIDSTFVAQPFNGPMSTVLGCPSDVEPRLRDLDDDAGDPLWDGDEPARSLGRISVGVALHSPVVGIDRVDVLTSADRVLFHQSGRAPDGRQDCGVFRDLPCEPFYDLYTRPVATSRVENACIRAGGSTFQPGSFDVRTVIGVTHVGCVRPDPSDRDRTEIQSYIEPAVGGPLVEGDPLAPDEEFIDAVPAGERGSQTGVVRRQTFNRLAQPRPGFTKPPEPTGEVYRSLESLSIQLQFPCERLLGRPLGIAPGARMFDCQSNKARVPSPDGSGDEQVVPASSPNGQVSYAIAGYGFVDRERRMFVDNEPNIERFTSLRDTGLTEDAEQSTDSGDPVELPPAPTAEDVSWTIEPAAYLASDIATLNHDPLDPVVEDFEPYASPLVFLPPPVLLAQVPRGVRTPMTIRIVSGTPRVEETKALPVAMLQAPPTVRGLGQQEDFTPEFAQSTTIGSETTTSKATRVGTHVGIEGMVSTGLGVLGSHIRGGVGFGATYEFMSEVEESLTKSFEVNTTEGYGGAFDDHTIVTRAIVEYVWDAIVVRDPAGFVTGQPFAYGVPAGEVTTAVPLSTLAEESPGLYGAGGVLRPSIDSIIGDIEIGNPASYPQTSEAQPDLLLRSSGLGGPCNGGYAAPGERTPPDGQLASVVDPGNPYFDTDPQFPTGPSVVTSGLHLVSAGNSLTESASIAFDASTTESMLTSKSHDWGTSLLFKLEYAQNNIASTAAELTISVGADAGFSTGAGVADTLGTGSGLSTVIGNIPLSSADKPWVDNEEYGWRMFMCKAQLGAAGLQSEIWVQGYLVDGYLGGGGIDALEPVDAVSPRDAAVMFADPSAMPSGSVTTCDVLGPRDNRFVWDQAGGTVDVYAVEFTNLTGGGGTRHVLSDRVGPADFRPEDRLDCAGVAAGDFVDGDLHRWRTVIDGFVDNRVTSEWEYFRPQVWAPDQILHVRTPIVNADRSVTVDIDDPDGVQSLLHDATVYAVDGATRTEVAHRGSIDGGRYRSPSLQPGQYEVRVVGHNSHRTDDGDRAETAPVLVQFRVEDGITAQFSTDGCAGVPCTTAEDVQFTDESLEVDGTPIIGWSWYFGDGTTSTLPNPSHRFTDLPSDGSSTRDVYLTVTDAVGRTDSVVQEVRLRSAAPEFDVAGLVTDARVGRALTMHLTVTDPDNEGRAEGDFQIPTVEWDLDDDGVWDLTEIALDSAATRTFGEVGEYAVRVRATDPHGESTEHLFTVTVRAVPTSGTGASPPPLPQDPVSDSVPPVEPESRATREVGPCEAEHPEAAAFVRSLLTDLEVVAPPDRVEALCPAALDDAGRKTLVQQIAYGSDHLEQVVVRGYERVLGRQPDAAGSAYWAELLLTRELTTPAFLAHLYASEEYFATARDEVDTWVAMLYPEVLHRFGEQSGVAYWTETARRDGRTVVARAMYGSLESRSARVSSTYRRLLDRFPEPDGARHWEEAISRPGQDDITLAIHLLTSEEYFDRAQTQPG